MVMAKRDSHANLVVNGSFNNGVRSKSLTSSPDVTINRSNARVIRRIKVINPYKHLAITHVSVRVASTRRGIQQDTPMLSLVPGFESRRLCSCPDVELNIRTYAPRY